MKGGKRPQGYTIVEVLIFMAVSGMMFVMAAIFINGKQANVQFRQSLLDVNSQIRTVINEVSNGEYDPLNGSCTATAGGTYPTISTVSTANQGTNGGANGCIFLGKVMQFNVGNDATKYDVYTIASRQMDAGGNPVNSFASAWPIPVTTPPMDLTVRKTTQNGLTITHQYLCNDPTCTSHTSVGAFGIFGSFNSSLGVASGAQQSGSQSITVAAIPSTNFGESEANMGGVTAPTVDSIKLNAFRISATTDTLGSGKFILLCLTDGNKVGSITVGGSNGQQFTTEVKTNGVFVLGAGHVC